MGLSKAVVKNRVLILMIALILLVPAVFGMLGTRINYDMLDYLPSDMDTVIGQETLKEDFGKGAFSFIVVQDMPVQEVAQLKEKIQQVDHVESVLWYDSVADLSIPMELLPDKLYNEFNTDDATMLAVFFDSATSEDVTMDAIREIRSIAGKQCFVSGMSALVTDLKDLCEQEEPIYVALAVACACAAMMLLLDGWLVPFVFLASIGMAIVYNLGSNFFLGEISYITKALSAVLQLAVTMDYSIFLWHSYNEQLTLQSDHKEAMAVAIHNTFTSVIGSSATTIAGFIALCFMSFTLGRDLGIVMAKGVLLGVLGCVTILPSLILVLDKPLQRTRHKSLIPDMGGFAKGVCKIFPVFLVIFALLIAPAYISYDKTNDEVYTMEQYQQSPELKAQVDAAVELQMQTPAMQQTISKNVTALMGTEEIRQKIDAATEQQVQLKIEETMASDEVQQKIMAATEQASAGAVQIRSLKQQLDQYNVFYMGLNSYTAGVDQAAAGARQLQSNMPALLDGVKQLRDGAMQLSDGLKQFNEEGVEKLVSVLGDDVEDLAERLTATVEVSRNYRSFSGLTDGMDGAVRFIYRTEAVEKAE